MITARAHDDYNNHQSGMAIAMTSRTMTESVPSSNGRYGAALSDSTNTTSDGYQKDMIGNENTENITIVQ